MNKVIDKQKDFYFNLIVNYKRYIIPEYRTLKKDIFTEKKVKNPLTNKSGSNTLKYV